MGVNRAESEECGLSQEGIIMMGSKQKRKKEKGKK